MLKLLIIFIILTLAEAGQKSKGFTKSKKGCKCWWDLEGVLIDPDTNQPYSCACCYPGGKQCGYPMHNWCTSAKSKFLFDAKKKEKLRSMSLPNFGWANPMNLSVVHDHVLY